MQYIHQSTYGHVGGVHTAKPVFAMDKGHIYEMKDGRPDTKAIYAVHGDKVFATGLHPNGASPHALFEIRGDKIHTTEHHPMHTPGVHTFEIRTHP